MSDDELTKLTVNLVPRAVAALDLAADFTGDSKTDTVNRALQLYATVVEVVMVGGGDVEFKHVGGRSVKLVVIP